MNKKTKQVLAIHRMLRAAKKRKVDKRFKDGLGKERRAAKEKGL